MEFLSKNIIPPTDKDDVVFCISLWGPLITFLLLLLALSFGIAIFTYCYQNSIIWGMILSTIYVLIMWSLCRIFWRALCAIRSNANWLVRIGPSGLLVKYRSYLHDDSPEEDAVAVRLSWNEIENIQLQPETLITTDTDGKRYIRRWFLAITMNSDYVDLKKVKTAIEFEHKRKPEHFKIDELKHALFKARKHKASTTDIEKLKQQIALAKNRHPGKHSKVRFIDRPVTFIQPNKLQMECSHLSPGKNKLRQLLEEYTQVIEDQKQHIDTTRKLTEKEFQTSLTILLRRNETFEAIKLIKNHLKLSTADAKAYMAKHIT